MKKPTIKLHDPATGKRQRILYEDYQNRQSDFDGWVVLDAPAGTPEHAVIGLPARLPEAQPDPGDVPEKNDPKDPAPEPLKPGTPGEPGEPVDAPKRRGRGRGPATATGID